MPNPKEGESKEKFINRATQVIINEAKAKGKTIKPDQAAAIAASMFDKKMEKTKGKETTAYSEVKIKEDTNDDGVHTFIGASTVPDRTAMTTKSGDEVVGEILSKQVLDKMSSMINDTSVMGGSQGSYRTVSLFHDRVYESDVTKEEAGFVKPNSRVVELKDHPGHHGLEVDVEVNKMYKPTTHPDYTPEKIEYKIDKKALGLSMEYNNTAEQEKTIEVGGKLYNYIMDTNDFRGFGFARANAIGNPTAISVKEIGAAIDKLNKKGEGTMSEEDAKIKEQLEAGLKESEAKIKELETEIAKAKEAKDGEKVKELEAKFAEQDAKLKEQDAKLKDMIVNNDKSLVKMKEQFGAVMQSFANGIKKPDINAGDKPDAKIKEINDSLEKRDWKLFKDSTNAKVKEQAEHIDKMLKGPGFDFDKHTTLKVKCKGRGFEVVSTAKTKEVYAEINKINPKTKDVLDANDMAEATYSQTNAFFADRYVPGITETFLMSDDLLKVLIKEQHIGGNDKYQWRLWTEFVTVTGDNTLAVDPNTTSVERNVSNFEKIETRIVEYRDGVEVTDFTQFHSAAAIGDLMGNQIDRAAKRVRQSMAADIFKAKVDNTTGWKGFVGLIGVADSATFTTMYGKSRSAANRLLDATTANTYNTTAEAITVPRVRIGYENVLAQGSELSQIVITMSPTQSRLLFNSQDASLRYQPVLTMAAAPADFGFGRGLIPHIDAIPVVRDYHAVDASGNFDMFAVVDVGPDGFVLVVSKPLSVRGLAKVGTSESAYVSFWGATVYKRPRNIFVHDDLTTT